jgi:hypothetical protein
MWDAHRRRKKDVLLISELNEFQGQTGVAYTEEARLLQLAVRKDAAAEHHGSGRRPSHGLATCTAVDRLVIKLQKGLDSYGRDFSWSYARRIAVFAGLIEGDKAAGERLRATLNRHTEKEVAWAEATRRLGEETRGKTRSRRRPARTKGRRLSQQSRTKRRRQ